MLTIEYIKTGKAYPDFEVEDKAKEIIDTHAEYADWQDMIYRTSTENLIEAIRLYIVENKVDLEIQFKFGEELMPVNKFGNPSYWAKGFCDFGHHRLHRLVKAQSKLRKEGVRQ